jgi:hypothetical protein
MRGSERRERALRIIAAAGIGVVTHNDIARQRVIGRIGEGFGIGGDQDVCGAIVVERVLEHMHVAVRHDDDDGTGRHAGDDVARRDTSSGRGVHPNRSEKLSP